MIQDLIYKLLGAAVAVAIIILLAFLATKSKPKTSS